MKHSRYTLALDDSWDLYLNEAGNIVTKLAAEATAQNVANECRLFIRDAYFEFDKGLPHMSLELGQKMPPQPLLRTFLKQAATRVSDVLTILNIDLVNFDQNRRVLTGDVSFVTMEGESVKVSL
jgi:hypothetical protein